MANIIPERYTEIWPSCTYLGDEAVLIQAWKKAHEYIRRQNWYADCLELDVTAATLQPFLGELRDRLSPGNLTTYRPDPMRMVPAPKSHPWLWNNNGWTPKSDDDKPFKLRPLAHLSITDQTVATAALICLANAVETAQGESSISEEDKVAGRYRTASYGNRLVCSWNEGRARFRWGNSQLYRKYYIDYQTYLYRGTSEAEKLATEDGKTIIVRTDLSQCYDRVDRAVLVERLRQLWLEYRQDEGNDDAFFVFLQRAFQWRWHEADMPLASEHLPSETSDHVRFGLPQGLAASGFFCNAYLVHFDRAIRHEIDNPDPHNRWQIRDYCRYVDDMTFLVQHDPTAPEMQVIGEFVEHLNALTAKHAPGQVVHKGKTSVTSLERQGRAVPLAGTMAAIQREVSGPMDVTTAEQVLGMLDGLFKKTAVVDAGGVPVDDSSPLSVLFATEPDVQPTTVDRFVANRWKSVFRTLRLMTGGDPGPSASLDSDIRLLDLRAVEMSRLLVRRWLDDPSNVRLLRIAFDLLPSPTYLEAILSLLRRYLFEEGGVEQKVRLTCLYVASELFRAAAVETGLAGDDDLYPACSDLGRYRDMLRGFARECIQQVTSDSWYLCQQIVVFLVTLGESPDSGRLGLIAGARYDALVSLLHGNWPETDCPVSEVVPLILLLERVLGSTDDAANLLVQARNRFGSDKLLTPFRLVLTENEELAKAFVRKLPTDQQTYWMPVLDAYGVPWERPSHPLKNGRWYNLATVIHHEGNPFRQEIAAVRLMLALVMSWSLRQQECECGILTPNRIEVSCCDWEHILDPNTFHDYNFLQSRILPAPSITDERFAVPSWCPVESRWKVEVAQVVRASIIGDCDYSSMLRIGTRPNLRQRYRGLRTSWIKRKHGLYNERSALGGWDVPVSPWLSEVLTVLLSWPGMVFTPQFSQVSGDMSPDDLVAALNDRLKILGEDYGRAIQAPVYVCPIRGFRPAIDAGKLTIGIVQMALPRDADFEKVGLQLGEQAYRRRHRRLLTAVLKLVQKTIDVRSRADDRRVTLDLVVLPELAVHVEDLGIIKQFINKLPCMVFCGLVFHDHPLRDGQLVNSGAWIIPQTGENGKEFLCIEQGKAFLTDEEDGWGIASYRPCQWVIQDTSVEKGWRLSAAICKDMTSAELHADMKNRTDGFVVSALTRDVHTFDDIVNACRFTMFQHIILVNSGQYGGSTVQAPYKQEYRRILVQHHGMDQTVVSICEVNLFSCREGKEVKTRPAGAVRKSGV